MSIPEGMIANDVATTALPWLISFSLARMTDIPSDTHRYSDGLRE
jgi:hypothetical protein